MKHAFLCAFALLATLAAHLPLRAGVETDEPHPMEDRFFTIVLSDEDRAAYDFMPDEEKEAFRSAYWARLDPTPTTRINEREVEHQRRVIAAIRRFRDISGFFIWDDRTRAHIRFGEPVSRRPLRDDPVPREVWHYPDMILWFEDLSLDGTYREGHVRPAPENRDTGAEPDTRRPDTEGEGRPADFSKDDSKLAVERAFQALSLDPRRGWELAAAGHERWEETPELNEYDHGEGEEIAFLFDASSLAGAGGKTDLLVGMLVANEALTFEGAGTGVSAKLRRRMALRDTAFAIAVQSEGLLDHRVAADRRDGGWLLTIDSFAVAPGPYQLVLRIDDLLSGGRGILITEMEVRDFREPTILVSDLVFASEISKSFRVKGLYERRGHKIVPRPARTYPPNDEVLVFFEIYHVSPGRGERHYCDVTYRLEGKKRGGFAGFFGGTDEGRFEEGESRAFSSIGRGPASARFITIDTNGLPPDEYRLTVEARDATTGEVARSEAVFHVANP